MNRKLARLLTQCYPWTWRERYGDEFEAFLSEKPVSVHTLVNVIWSALCERIIPTQEGEMDPHIHAFSFRFRLWCVRAPWAMFGFAPLILLLGAYFVACIYLWSLWHLFLPGTDTPFGHPNTGPIYGFQNISVQAGKFYYFGAPILVGWVVGVTAVRHGVKTIWPIVGMILIAWMGATAQIQASRTVIPGGLAHIRMSFFDFGPSAEGLYDTLFHALLILSFTALPYLVLRFRKDPSIPV